MFADIILPLHLSQAFTYEIPESLTGLERGMRCVVPVGHKKYVGCVLDIHTTKPNFKTKEIIEALDTEPLLNQHQLNLMKWASAYYLTPLGEVFRHFLPASLSEIKKSKIKRTVKDVSHSPDFSFEAPVQLTTTQQDAIDDILKTLEPTFIHGITGSGKTEIYRKISQAILNQDGQVLILVPEIGLTPQTIGRFESLGIRVGIYHSGLTPAQRLKTWTDVREGHLSLVIATRSGIFLPFQKLKLIVIDEEHDSSYKQDERFCYHARDLALWRGEHEKIKIVLGSATPSLEMIHRVKSGKIKRILLMERATGISLPKVETIDLRNMGNQKSNKELGIFSLPLLNAIEENLKNKNQSLVFFNRRGFAPFVICRTCGDVPMCEQCDITLTLHKSKTKAELICHYCDTIHPYLPLCQSCGKDTKHYTGYGTERVEEELRKFFPSARLGRLDRDSAKGKSWLTTLEKMKKGEIDILIGTQMVTKGHDYPQLTLVCILDADAALHLPDFRSSERTFQMITQVSGRAGRHEKPGTVLIQSYFPDHPSLEFAMTHNSEGFYERELQEREEANYPPFCRMIEIRLAGKKQSDVIQKIQLLTKKITSTLPANLAIILGPGPHAIEKIREYYRWKLLIKTKSYLKIQPALRRVLDDFNKNHLSSTMRLLVNVDPVDMM